MGSEDVPADRTVKRTTSVERIFGGLRSRLGRSKSTPLVPLPEQHKQLPERPNSRRRHKSRRGPVDDKNSIDKKTHPIDKELLPSHEDAEELRVGQHVRYYHRPSRKWIDQAYIVSVHGGGDFTIRYLDAKSGTEIEKQTTRDRLDHVLPSSIDTATNPQSQRISPASTVVTTDGSNEPSRIAPQRTRSDSAGPQTSASTGQNSLPCFQVNQCARYYHAHTQQWIECEVIQSHGHNDYTIRFKDNKGGWIERETTGDRLLPVDNRPSSSNRNHGSMPSSGKSPPTNDPVKRPLPIPESDRTNSRFTQPTNLPTSSPSSSSTDRVHESDIRPSMLSRSCSTDETSGQTETTSPHCQRSRSPCTDSDKEHRGFTKNEQVRYFHKPSGRWFDHVFIVRVHSQGPNEEIFYTIQYTDDSGSITEKQTTGDRLQSVLRPPSDESDRCSSRNVVSEEPTLKRSGSSEDLPVESNSANDDSIIEKSSEVPQEESCSESDANESENMHPMIDDELRTSLRDRQTLSSSSMTPLVNSDEMLAKNQFARNQLVRYFHRPSRRWIDDVLIIGTHFDDGPDAPYYTIRYKERDGSWTEKQTTLDRLEHASTTPPSDARATPIDENEFVRPDEEDLLQQALASPNPSVVSATRLGFSPQSESRTEHVRIRTETQADPEQGGERYCSDDDGDHGDDNHCSSTCAEPGKLSQRPPPQEGPTTHKEDRTSLSDGDGTLKQHDSQTINYPRGSELEVKNGLASRDVARSVSKLSSDGDSDGHEIVEQDDLPEVTEMEHRERSKRSMLESQRRREDGASSISQFARNQRVRYFHKLSQTWFDDAYVVGVHFDDGYDKPYYTIRYVDNGAPDSPILQERQTTSDRLEAVKWDREKSWSILSPTAPKD